jgi:hypothetical protein
MKFTAILTALMGVMIGCFAGYHYASGGPPGRAENPSVLGLVLPLAFAAALVIAGAAMWVVGGRGSTASAPASDRLPAGASGG